jgi:succinyl-CoA synthetase beta subunit
VRLSLAPPLQSARLARGQTPVRFLNLHEYQSKDLMSSFGVVVQRGKMAASAAEASTISAEILKSNPKAELILKAQIHAGGRGKGHFDNGFKGGVKICSTPSQVAEYTGKMLGAKLITKQTGPEGQLCSKVLVNEGINISKEYYFAILMDRKYGGPVLVASTQGGMDIEEVAEKNPEAIITEPVDITKGLGDAQAEALAVKLGFKGKLVQDAAKQFKSLYKMFEKTDATQVSGGPALAHAARPLTAPTPPQVEINPLAIGTVPGVPNSESVFARRCQAQL